MQHALLETIYGEKKQWGLNVGVKIDKIWKIWKNIYNYENR